MKKIEIIKKGMEYCKHKGKYYVLELLDIDGKKSTEKICARCFAYKRLRTREEKI